MRTALKLAPPLQVDVERQAYALVADGLEMAVRGLRLWANRPGPEPPAEAEGNWIYPHEAAQIAGFRTATPEQEKRALRRIYDWARGKSWASRPNQRTLLIQEVAFRRWLKNRTYGGRG